jgi:hypothetical protein
MGRIKTTGELELTAGSTLDIDGVGALQINSSAAAISMGNDATSQAINIGTGAAARTITIGNTTGATAVNINIGTGDFAMASASGTLISQLDTGEMTQPIQTAFLAIVGAAQNSVTGNSATYTIGTSAMTEVFDQGNDFNTNGTFTASVTARFYIRMGVSFNGLTALMTKGFITIITSNRTYLATYNIGLARDSDNFAGLSMSVFADMDAADTATFTVQVLNGATNAAGVRGNATNALSYVAGFLIA